ncbi:hypothetical protein NXS19_010039 [Fusarium pseudograminearum]|nr:hypothetical protein NXS19_010039 [Fusarium pseudograminearum]
MIERTIAALESRSLHRIIHKSSNPSRKLHAGFWQHGAAALDLSGSLPGSIRAVDAATPEPETKQLQANLFASVLMLDFLYPTSTLPPLRCVYHGLPNPQHAQRTAIVPMTQKPHELQPEEGTNIQIGTETMMPSKGQTSLELLKRIMTTKGRHFQQAWDLYSGLETHERRAVRSSLKVEQWLALDVWASYYKGEVTKTRPNLERLQQLGSLAQKGDLYFDFRAYLVGEGKDQHKEIQNDMVAKRALSALRRFFAILALREPCPPAQASIILEALRDNNEYNTYLNTMFNRWYDKLEDRSTMEQLPAIYQKQRELPNASPAMPVYRGMFKVNFPNNRARLEELHHDWVRFKGGLNQWGYEKFLKYYASRGDVPSVKKLWDQFIKEYPELLRESRGFNSLINVHAQVGDVEGVKEVLGTMVDRYNVQPDLDNWNMLLKAYMRTNDYDGVLDLFDQISSQHEPDSYTYAHVMAMSSKKGDLDTTLEYFTKSQQAGVPITREMGLALVVAYGRNGQLLEAESLCIEMTHRKIASQAIWNQLLNFNGVEGKIDKVYELLRRMRELGVEWDDQTYQFLLQALVRVNRIHPAYNLLKRAVDERLFLVTPEHYAIVMATGARLGKRSSWKISSINLRNQSCLCKQRREPQAFNSRNRRAIALLVELREFGSIEELMGLFVQIFPQYQTGQQFPPEIMSALMHAHYADENYDKVLELWEKTWQDVYKSSRKRSGDGIAGGTEYDLCRVVDVMARAYAEKEDGKGLSDTIDKVIAAGFKLTRQNWVIIIRNLSELGRWERAMYWCETLLMPGWDGWAYKRDIPAKRRNTRLLSPPHKLVLRLQQKWLEMRKMAAWSPDVSRLLSTVEEKYPRLHHAFTTSEIESMPTTYSVNGKEISAGELDGVLQGLPYQSLLKVKESLKRDLEKQRKVERSLGTPKETVDKAEWKKMLHDKVHRYSKMWFSARKKAYDEQLTNLRGFDSTGAVISIEAKEMGQEDADHRATREQFAYWNEFWDRYDQRRHGYVPKQPTRPSGYHRKNPLEAQKIREWRNNRNGRNTYDN